MTAAPSFDNFAFIEEESESNSETSEPSDNEGESRKTTQVLSLSDHQAAPRKPFIKNTLLIKNKSLMEKKNLKSLKNGKQGTPNRNKKSAQGSKNPPAKVNKKKTSSSTQKKQAGRPKKNSFPASTSSKTVNKRVLKTDSHPNKKPKSIDNLSININSSSRVEKPPRTSLKKKILKNTVPFMSREYQQLKDTCQELLTSIIFK